MREERDESYSHVLKYTGIFGGVQGINILIGLVRNKAMALLLGAGGMGLSALMTSAQNFAAQCTSLGISFGAVPRLSEYHEHDDDAQLSFYIQVTRLWSMIAAVLGCIFCVLVSPLINDLSFAWGNHTLHYAMLAVSVAVMAIAGGETAILKATRRLGALAKIQVFSAVISVVISVALYYFFYHSGVVPAIVMTAIVTMLTTIAYSYRYYPLRLHFNSSHLKQGAGMVKLGVAFVVAAAIGSASEMFIRSFLNVEGGLNDVAFYNAAYMISITYAGMVFSAMETDYFPRLSGVAHDIQATNETVNKQTEVSLLLLSPMLAALMAMMPVLIPLLFSKEFLPIVGMAQVAVLAMYFKVLTLPVAYITLARGHSLSFLFLESAYFVVLVLSVVVGYTYWDIYGTGVAIVVAHIFDYLMIYAYAHDRYSYRSTATISRYAIVQLSIGVLAFCVSLLGTGWTYWIAEAALAFVSTAYSIYILRQKTHLWEALRRKLLRI